MEVTKREEGCGGAGLGDGCTREVVGSDLDGGDDRGLVRPWPGVGGRCQVGLRSGPGNQHPTGPRSRAGVTWQDLSWVLAGSVGWDLGRGRATGIGRIMLSPVACWRAHSQDPIDKEEPPNR
jgi:hypothetical protein